MAFIIAYSGLCTLEYVLVVELNKIQEQVFAQLISITQKNIAKQPLGGPTCLDPLTASLVAQLPKVLFLVVKCLDKTT